MAEIANYAKVSFTTASPWMIGDVSLSLFRFDFIERSDSVQEAIKYPFQLLRVLNFLSSLFIMPDIKIVNKVEEVFSISFKKDFHFCS